MSQHNNTSEGIVDVGVGVLLSVGSFFVKYGEHIKLAIITAIVGTIVSITVRIIYKKWFKKYFEK